MIAHRRYLWNNWCKAAASDKSWIHDWATYYRAHAVNGARLLSITAPRSSALIRQPNGPEAC
eukprot:7103521-Pyramimonas_sp.AAC.1